jgi:hypothetical protein
MVRMIVKAVPERIEYIKYLKKNLPDAEFCIDKKRSAWDTFLRSLEMAGIDACLHMEEDIILTKNFKYKINAVISEKPDNFIQFFSMRKKDLTDGSRWDNNFLMNQCWYSPKGYSKAILDFALKWAKDNLDKHPSGTDTMVSDFLKSRKEKYWIHCPSLVDHRVAKSMIDPRRSSKRQSLTFVDPI